MVKTIVAKNGKKYVLSMELIRLSLSQTKKWIKELLQQSKQQSTKRSFVKNRLLGTIKSRKRLILNFLMV